MKPFTHDAALRSGGGIDADPDAGPPAAQPGGIAEVSEPRQPGLTLTHHQPSVGVLLIKVRGELDSVGARRVRTLLDQQLDSSRYRRVVLDLTDLTLLSSAGVELLVELHRRSRTARFALILVGSSRPRVECPLRLCGMLPLFTTRPTVGHALASSSNRTGALPPMAAR